MAILQKFTGQFPVPNQPIVTADGRPVQTMANLLKAIATFFSQDLNAQVTQADGVGGLIAFPIVKTYTLIEKQPYDFTINEFVGKLGSGTLTCKLQINGVDVAGSPMNATNVQQTNVIAGILCAAGVRLTLVVSAVAAPTDFAFDVNGTRLV